MIKLTPQEIEDFKQHRWFIMHHLDNCSICDKQFDSNENSYFGHLKDNSYAYTCKKCSHQMKDAQIYTNNHTHPYKIPAPNTNPWRYMDLAKFLSLLESNSLFFTRLDHFQDPFEGALGTKRNEISWSIKEQQWRQNWIEVNNKSNKACLSNSEMQLLTEEKFKKYQKKHKEMEDTKLCKLLAPIQL